MNAKKSVNEAACEQHPKGLSEAEAQQRLLEHGRNEIEPDDKQSLIIRFLLQFKDIMVLILIAAAIVSLVVTIVDFEHEGLKGFVEPLVIFMIVITNAVIGLIQEGKAERALEALSNMSAPKARVIRDGVERIIDAALIVPDDIIIIEAGDFVPADSVLVQSSSLKCEESAITGESVPVEKNHNAVCDENAPLGDRFNMVFSGTAVTYGTAVARVSATGKNTEMGRIAALIKGEKKNATPLQQKLAVLGKYLTIVALAACLIIFIVGIASGLPTMEIFMSAISLAVSAIPEALPAVVTVVLSLGVQRMIKRNAIIKRIPAVETLGSASVICSDKTGTLTQNKMTIVKAFSMTTLKTCALDDSCDEAVKEILKYGTLCSNASVTRLADGKEELIGDPTETAIVSAALKNGISKADLTTSCPRLKEYPFDSDRKLMTTINTIDGKTVVIVKGAIDEMTQLVISQNTDIALKAAEEMSREALRVIGIGYKIIDDLPKNDNPAEVEFGLTLIGLVGMIDPPREEVKQAVLECRMAGIKPVMITGDHKITASAIAMQLGILGEGDEVVTGKELDAMTDVELMNKIKNISVYARVTPSDKIRIVKAWQSRGEVVAMTGDGVNDAPALKAADIGCAMGITGTDVAKGAADIILTDDNFTTIVHAVKEGRGVYDNILKVVSFLLGTNIGEILVVFTIMMMYRQSPLIAIQLLWINLVTDTMPAITLGLEKIEPDIMTKKPRPRGESLFAHGFGIKILLSGILFGGISVIGYIIGLNEFGQEGARTMCFIILGFSQIVQVFNLRSHHPLTLMNPFSNKKLNMAALLSVALMVCVIFIPALSGAFGMIALTTNFYLISFAIAFSPFFVLEIYKYSLMLIQKHKMR